MDVITQIKQAAYLIRRNTLRDLRNIDVCLLLLAVFLFTTITAGFGFFSASVQQALRTDIASFLGADIVVEGHQALPDSIRKRIDEFNVPVVETVQLTHGITPRGKYQAVEIKWVESGYPLQGSLRLRQSDGALTTAEIPQAGSIWIGPQLHNDWNLNVGDAITVGKAKLLISGIVDVEPDRLTQFQHAMPRVMMNRLDMEASGFSLNKGRARYRYLMNASAPVQQQLMQVFSSLSHDFSVLSASEGQHPFARLASAGRQYWPPLPAVSARVAIPCLWRRRQYLSSVRLCSPCWRLLSAIGCKRYCSHS